MSKQLREIAPMRAPEIASAVMIGKVVYVYDHRSNILFIMPCDALLGYTATTLTVRLAAHALTYNNMGTQIGLQTIATR
jgi:hypothetical protein